VLNIEYNNTMTSDEKIKESQQVSELLYDLKPAYQTIISGDITNGINWFADKEKIDWMVMIPKKHNLVEKVFGRSQTKELLHHTHLPVLCSNE